MTSASRIIWFDENAISFVNNDTKHSYKSGESVIAEYNNVNTTFTITLKDSNKHWPTGSKNNFKFEQTDPENPIDPMWIIGIPYTTLNKNYFTFTSNSLYGLFEYNSSSSSQDKENSFHFNGLLDNNNQVIQDKDIVTNNPNVIATSEYDRRSRTDHITITAKSGYKITNLKIYTRFGGSARFDDYTKELNTIGNFEKYFDRQPISTNVDNDFYSDASNVWGYYVKVTTVQTAPVEPTEPTIDLKVEYNNGVSDVINTFPKQKAGTITGTVKAGAGYNITGVTSAYYNSGRPGVNVQLQNFSATKLSNYQYTYKFDLKDTDINTLTATGGSVKLGVNTVKEAGTIVIDSSKLINCSVYPSSITQDKETVLTLNANRGYVLNGTGSYTVDGKTTSFTCNQASSYQITVTTNSSLSISFTATKVEVKPGSITHTYVLDQDDYNNLGNQIVAGVDASATGFQQYNYTKFVNYLYQIPFDIGTDVTTSSNTINLGLQYLNLECRKITRETIDIDLGMIDLTDVANSNDMKPINITLYCPFSNNIVLPTTVLNSKLNLSFVINLKAEQAILLIKQNGNVIYSGETELFTDLPLYFTAGTQDTLLKQFKAQYQNTIKQAYVVINYNKPITGLTSYKTTEHGTLSSYKGFTRVSRGTLKQSISSEIDNALIGLLRQGVIIK